MVGNKHIKIFLVLLQCCISMAELNIDCNGKAFHCLNATHFKICVDLGGGVSKTVDDFLLPCPENTFCMPTNHFECEYHEITTSTTTSTTTTATTTSDFSEVNALSKVSVIPLLSVQKISETATAANSVQDYTDHKVNLTQEILETPATDSILNIFENTLKIPAFKSVKDEKLIRDTPLETDPTESFLVSEDESFNVKELKNDTTKYFENRTKDYEINNKTLYSSVKSDGLNGISDKNVTLNETTGYKNVNNMNITQLPEQENMTLYETETNVKNFGNISNHVKNVFFANDSESLERNVSINTGSERNVNGNNKTTSLDPYVSYSFPEKKSIKGDETVAKKSSTEPSSSNEVIILLNKSSDKNSIGKKLTSTSAPIVNSSLAMQNDSNDIIIKLNISSGETMNPEPIATTVPTNNVKYDVELLDNFLTVNANPNTIVNGSDLSYKKNDTVINNSDIHKPLKGSEFEEESTANVRNFPTIFEDVNSNSSLSLNPTKSVEIVIPTTNVAELRHEIKMETKNSSEFSNSNNLSMSQNETKAIRESVEVTLSQNLNNDNNNNIFQGSKTLNPDIIVTTIPTNDDKYNVQVVNNILSVSTYPNIIINGSNLLNNENQTATNNSDVQKLLNGPDFKEESTAHAANLSNIFEDFNSNSSLSLDSTKTDEIIIPSTKVAELRHEIKMKTNISSELSNSNNLSMSQNEIKSIRGSVDVKLSQNFNDDNNNNMFQGSKTLNPDIIVTTMPTNNEKYNEQVVNNILSVSTYPNIILNGSNTLYKRNQTAYNNSAVHKLLKGTEFNGESTAYAANLSNIFEDDNYNSSSSHNVTDSAEIIIPTTSVAELRYEIKMERNDPRDFNNQHEITRGPIDIIPYQNLNENNNKINLDSETLKPDVIDTTTPINSKKYNVELLDNFMNPNTPIIEVSDFSHDKKNETITNNYTIDNISKGLEFEEKRTMNTDNLSNVYEDVKSNSSSSFNSTGTSEVIITTTNGGELRHTIKIETNNSSWFSDSNKFSLPLNETKTLREAIQITQSKNLNKEINKILGGSNISSISKLQTTSNDNEVVKSNTSNLNVEDLRNYDYYKNDTNYNDTDFRMGARDNTNNINILYPNYTSASLKASFENNTRDALTNEDTVNTFTDDYNNKNVPIPKAKTIYYETDFGAGEKNKSSIILYPDYINASVPVSKLENISSDALKMALDNNENSNGDIITSSISGISHSLPITTNTVGENYVTDDTFPSFIDDKDTNNSNNSTASNSPFVHPTIEINMEPKTKDNNYSYLNNYLRDEVTSSIDNTKQLSDLLDEPSNTEHLNTTYSIIRNLSASTSSEGYEANRHAIDLSLSNLRDVVYKSINESLDINHTINATNTLSGTSLTMGQNSKIDSADSNIAMTYSEPNNSSLLFTTTDNDAISVITDKSYMTNFKENAKQINLTNMYFAKENFIKNASKVSGTQNNKPITYDLQEKVNITIVPSILKNTQFDLLSTQIEQNYVKENDRDSKPSSNVTPSIQIANEKKNTTTASNDFQEFSSNYFDLASSRVNETLRQIHQVELNKPNAMVNSSEKNKHLLSSPIHLLLLSKSNSSAIHENNNLDATSETFKPVRLDATIEDKVVQNTSLDNISEVMKEENKSTTSSYQEPGTHHISPVTTNMNPTSKDKTYSSNLSFQIDVSVTENKSQLEQKLNTTKNFPSTLPIILVEVEKINDTDNFNLHGTKHNMTVEHYQKDLPLKIAEKNTSDAINVSTDKNIVSKNTTTWFEDHPKDVNTSDMSVNKTTLATLLEGDIIFREPFNATLQVNISNLSLVSFKRNNVSTDFINRLVTDFYAKTSENESDVELQINPYNNAVKSGSLSKTTTDSPMDMQLTKLTQSSKSESKFVDDVDALKSTNHYEYTTKAYSSKSELNNNGELREPAVIYTISDNRQIQKLSEIDFSNQYNTTRPIKTSDTKSTERNYLLTQYVSAPDLTSTDKAKKTNVTESNLLNVSNTNVIEPKTKLSGTTVNSNRNSTIYNIPGNKAVTNSENLSLFKHKDLEINTTNLQFTSNSNQNKTLYTGVNLNNASVIREILPIAKDLNVHSPIHKNVKVATKINDSHLNDSNVNNISSFLLVSKSAPSNQTTNYNQTRHATTDLSKNIIKNNITNKCLNQSNGKYADKDDCKKFYLCLGDAMPVMGECPNGTVFSESKKQCTKNLSQCYRNNQFTCLSPGRYYDLNVKNVYYVCVKNRDHFTKFKYQCLKGYNLNETIVKCIKDSDTTAQKNSDSNTKEESTSNSVESSSKATETMRETSKRETEFKCKKEGKFPHPKKCDQYYTCTKIKKSVFRKKLKTCDSGEVFDKEKRHCIDSDSNEC